MSFLSAVGHDIKSVFSWLASPKGQSVILTGEGIATAINPGLAAIFPLVNSWITKAISIEALAAAAGAQEGSGAQKAAAVIGSILPEIQKAFPNATLAQAQNANTALIAFLNAFEAPAVPPAQPTA
jgi:hypothetical protein